MNDGQTALGPQKQSFAARSREKIRGDFFGFLGFKKPKGLQQDAAAIVLRAIPELGCSTPE